MKTIMETICETRLIVILETLLKALLVTFVESMLETQEESLFLVIKYPIKNFAVCFINLCLIEIDIDIGHCIVPMTKCMANDISRNV